MAQTLNSIKNYWFGLIAVCLSLNLSGQEVVVDDDRQSPYYGNVTLTNLAKGIIGKIESKSFSDKDFSKFFFLRVGSSKINVLGNYKLNAEGIVFTPRFVPDASLTHFIHFDPASLSHLIDENITGNKIIREVKFPLGNFSKTEIKFYPESDTLPANVLRAYIYFSQAMSLQNPYEFIRVYDAEGTPVNEPFVEVTEGLWNEDRTRLTLFFHPGRIKRGVGPNVKHGAIFEKGKSYSLVTSGDWKNAQGLAISPYKKTLIFRAPVRKKLNIDNWKLEIPHQNSITPLIFKVLVQLDNVLLNRTLSIEVRGKLVNGQWRVAGDLIKFFPDSPWAVATYRLIVDEALEDICGNTPTSAFDREIQLSQEVKLEREFQIK